MWPVYTVTTKDGVHVVLHDYHNRACCSCNPQHVGWWQHSCVHVACADKYHTALGVFDDWCAPDELLECAKTGIVTEDQLKIYHETINRRNAKKAKGRFT